MSINIKNPSEIIPIAEKPLLTTAGVDAFKSNPQALIKYLIEGNNPCEDELLTDDSGGGKEFRWDIVDGKIKKENHSVAEFLLNAAYQIQSGDATYATVMTKEGLIHLVQKISTTLSTFTSLLDEDNIATLAGFIYSLENVDNSDSIVDELQRFMRYYYVGRRSAAYMAVPKYTPYIDKDTHNPIYVGQDNYINRTNYTPITEKELLKDENTASGLYYIDCYGYRYEVWSEENVQLYDNEGEELHNSEGELWKITVYKRYVYSMSFSDKGDFSLDEKGYPYYLQNDDGSYAIATDENNNLKTTIIYELEKNVVGDTVFTYEPVEGSEIQGAEYFNQYDGPGFKYPRGIYSHQEGYGNQIAENSNYTHVEGYKNIAHTDASYNHIEGAENESQSQNTHIEGKLNKSNSANYHIHLEGYNNQTTNGNHIHIEGYSNTSNDGSYNHMEGSGNINEGSYNHIEGQNNEIIVTAQGNKVTHCHVQGSDNEVANYYIDIGGKNNKGNGFCSFIRGNNLVSNANYQTVVGQYNQPNQNAIFIVGNGKAANAETGTPEERRNALEVGYNGIVQMNYHPYTGELKYTYNTESLKDANNDMLYVKADGSFVEMLNTKQLELNKTIWDSAFRPTFSHEFRYIREHSTLGVQDVKVCNNKIVRLSRIKNIDNNSYDAKIEIFRNISDYARNLAEYTETFPNAYNFNSDACIETYYNNNNNKGYIFFYCASTSSYSNSLYCYYLNVNDETLGNNFIKQEYKANQMRIFTNSKYAYIFISGTNQKITQAFRIDDRNDIVEASTNWLNQDFSTLHDENLSIIVNDYIISTTYNSGTQKKWYSLKEVDEGTSYEGDYRGGKWIDHNKAFYFKGYYYLVLEFDNPDQKVLHRYDDTVITSKGAPSPVFTLIKEGDSDLEKRKDWFFVRGIGETIYVLLRNDGDNYNYSNSIVNFNIVTNKQGGTIINENAPKDSLFSISCLPIFTYLNHEVLKRSDMTLTSIQDQQKYIVIKGTYGYDLCTEIIPIYDRCIQLPNIPSPADGLDAYIKL